MTDTCTPTQKGYFGNFGGQYISESLKEEFQKITDIFYRLKDDKSFKKVDFRVRFIYFLSET